ARLEGLARDFGAARALAAASPQDAETRLLALEAGTAGLARRLAKDEQKSLYDLKVLRRAAEQSARPSDAAR
ncbi:MAG TPA: hypothetical protein VNH64_11640, partial [Parvularculaceae bacterium]|nr:hypothetical protein [Parvularculaceae bacterium]